MNSTLRRIQRLRSYQERLSRLDVVQAETDRDRLSEERDATIEQVRVSRQNTASNDPDSLARHHAFALRKEMQRRGEDDAVARSEEVVANREIVWRAADKERRVAENLVEHREERHRWELAQRDQRALDEVALQGWWRKTT